MQNINKSRLHNATHTSYQKRTLRFQLSSCFRCFLRCRSMDSLDNIDPVSTRVVEQSHPQRIMFKFEKKKLEILFVCQFRTRTHNITLYACDEQEMSLLFKTSTHFSYNTMDKMDKYVLTLTGADKYISISISTLALFCSIFF